MGDETALTAMLSTLPLAAREELRRLLVTDQPERDAVARSLLRRGATDLADLLDLLSLAPDDRRRIARVLGELAARDGASS